MWGCSFRGESSRTTWKALTEALGEEAGCPPVQARRRAKGASGLRSCHQEDKLPSATSLSRRQVL